MEQPQKLFFLVNEPQQLGPRYYIMAIRNKTTEDMEFKMKTINVTRQE